MTACIVNSEASRGLITIRPSPVASREALPLTMCAVIVKWASVTLAASCLARISAALGGFGDWLVLVTQAARKPAASGSRRRRRPLMSIHPTDPGPEGRASLERDERLVALASPRGRGVLAGRPRHAGDRHDDRHPGGRSGDLPGLDP